MDKFETLKFKTHKVVSKIRGAAEVEGGFSSSATGHGDAADEQAAAGK